LLKGRHPLTERIQFPNQLFLCLVFVSHVYFASSKRIFK